MKPLLFFFIMLLVAGCFEGLAYADYYSQEFGDMDSNHDDFVNFDEYKYYVVHSSYEAFKTIDTNQDERIDFFEWVAHQEKQNPFKSLSEFRYKGENGDWYVDRNGKCYRDRDEYCLRSQPDYWPHHWHHPWPAYRWHHWHDHWRHNHFSFGLGF